MTAPLSKLSPRHSYCPLQRSGGVSLFVALPDRKVAPPVTQGNAFAGSASRASCFRQGRIYPSDVPIGPAVNHIHAAMSSVAEYNYVRLGQIQLHHRLAHAHGAQVLGGLGDHRRGEILVELGIAHRRGQDIGRIAVPTAIAVDVTPMILELALVAPQPLFDMGGHVLISG